MLTQAQPKVTAILAASSAIGLLPVGVATALRALVHTAASKGFALMITDHKDKKFMLANAYFPQQMQNADSGQPGQTIAELSHGRFYKSLRFVAGSTGVTDRMLMAALDVLGCLENAEIAWDNLSDHWARLGSMGMEAA